MDSKLNDEIYDYLAAKVGGNIGEQVRPILSEAAKEFDVPYNRIFEISREVQKDYRKPVTVIPDHRYDEAIHRYIREHVPDKIEGESWLAQFNEEIAKGVGCSIQVVRKVTHRYKEWSKEDGVSVHQVMLNMRNNN